MNGGDDHLLSEFELNAAIARALRVEGEAHRLHRLAAFWRARSQAQRRRQRNVRLVAFACAAAAVFGIVAVVWNRADVPPAVPVAQSPPVETTEPRGSAKNDLEPVSSPAQPILEPPTGEPPRFAGRPATAYERYIFIARTRAAGPARPTSAAIDSLIQAVAADDGADPHELLASTGFSRLHAENHLLRKLERAKPAEQRPILKLLAACGSRRSIYVLLRCARNDTTRGELLAALAAIVGENQLPAFIASLPASKERTALVSLLYSLNSESALRGYLALVRDPALRAETLAVAKASNEQPVAELFALLGHDQEAVRLAAAMLLGHINGPDISRQLIERVANDPSASPEAWMALMVCRGELATEFLSYAAQRPQLLGHVNSARVRLMQFVH